MMKQCIFFKYTTPSTRIPVHNTLNRKFIQFRHKLQLLSQGYGNNRFRRYDIKLHNYTINLYQVHMGWGSYRQICNFFFRLKDLIQSYCICLLSLYAKYNTIIDYEVRIHFNGHTRYYHDDCKPGFQHFLIKRRMKHNITHGYTQL